MYHGLGLRRKPPSNPTNVKVIELYDSAKYGKVEIVKAYVKMQNTHIDLPNCNGVTALLLAVLYSDVTVLKTLIAAGANVNVNRSKGNPCMTPIMTAVTRKQTKCLQALVEGGARISDRRDDGSTPLMIAVAADYLEGVQILLKAGADANEVNYSGQTPLIVCATYGTADILHTLVQHGANVKSSTQDGNTALMLVCSRDWVRDKERLAKCVRTLIRAGSRVNEKNKEGNTALILNAQTKCTSTIIFEALLQAGANPNIQNNSGKTALMFTIAKNKEFSSKLLIKNSALVSVQDNDGKTALMYAAEKGNDIFCKLLIQNSALVNVQDNHGKTALMYAAEKGKESICTLLIQNSADLNAQDKDGKTALMYVTNIKCLELLLSAGADTEIRDNLQCTALVYFLRKNQGQFSNNDCVTCILEHGANPVLEPCHRSVLTSEIFKLSLYLYSVGFLEHTSTVVLQNFRLVVCNGVVIKNLRKQHPDLRYNTPFGRAVRNENVALAKYFICTCYLIKTDVEDIHAEHDDIRDNSEIEVLLKEASSHPWPLVKLAFIAVSSALGASPERENRIKETQLPPRLQHMLMFQEPVSRLPVSEWADIPLCFDPTEYEKLPKPRPLIYYWPFGRDLVV